MEEVYSGCTQGVTWTCVRIHVSLAGGSRRLVSGVGNVKGPLAEAATQSALINSQAHNADGD